MESKLKMATSFGATHTINTKEENLDEAIKQITKRPAEEYAIEAIRELGPLRGCYYAAKRLLHCHPWGTSGYDPVLPKEDQPSATNNDERMI